MGATCLNDRRILEEKRSNLGNIVHSWDYRWGKNDYESSFHEGFSRSNDTLNQLRSLW